MIGGMFSFIVPCHKLYKRVLDDRYEVEACIDSILDQDYDNYEIIVVANGEQRKEIIDFLKKYEEKITVYESTEGNAAIARNVGAAVSKGEFRSYFSCDLTLYPGILRSWAKAFKRNPDVSIIYAEGIDWVKGGKPIDFRAIAPEYNEYQMTCHNLIDGANPVRSKDDQPWDTDVKALQDWNWALKVLKPLTPDAKKALLIKDVFYTTEEPKEGGLSDYFRTHWLELNDQIKEKNNLPIRNICVTSLGAPVHGLRTAQLLDADFVQMPSQHEHNYDAVYLLGYYISNMVMHNRVFSGMKRNGVKVIHWIGTDVLQLMHMPWISEKNLAQALMEYIDIHVCESEFIQKELAELGIESVVHPLPLDGVKYPFYTEVPKEYTVAVYAPHWDDENQRKYNLPLMTDIMRSMPDFKFILFGNKDCKDYPSDMPENIELRGWVDVKDVARDSNILLRFPFHDGLPVTACEFLLCGRDVAASHPMVGAYWLESGMIDGSQGTADYEQAKYRIIKQLRLAKKVTVAPEIRSKNRDYWSDKLDPKKFKANIIKLIDDRQKEVTKKLKEKFKENQANDPKN